MKGGARTASPAVLAVGRKQSCSNSHYFLGGLVGQDSARLLNQSAQLWTDPCVLRRYGYSSEYETHSAARKGGNKFLVLLSSPSHFKRWSELGYINTKLSRLLLVYLDSNWRNACLALGEMHEVPLVGIACPLLPSSATSQALGGEVEVLLWLAHCASQGHFHNTHTKYIWKLECALTVVTGATNSNLIQRGKNYLLAVVW